MDILDGRDFCPECGGCGVLFAPDGWVGKEFQRCDKCNRFKDDLEAAKAAGELIRAVYANHRRALDLNAGTASILVTTCLQCPCFSRVPEEHDNCLEDSCGMLKPEKPTFDYPREADNSVASNCPLKKFSLVLRAVR